MTAPLHYENNAADAAFINTPPSYRDLIAVSRNFIVEKHSLDSGITCRNDVKMAAFPSCDPVSTDESGVPYSIPLPCYPLQRLCHN